MATNEVEIRVTADTKAAERGLTDMRKSIDKFARRARVAGAALTGIGVVGAVGLKKLIDSYKEQEIGINRLNQALVNVGTTYGDQEAAIESVIASIQDKTNFADEESREVLVRLVGVLGDEKKALEALPVVLDAAAFSGKSAGTVAETLSKFLAGLANTSDATGVSVDATATFAERLAEVMAVTAGQAEAAVDPMTQLGNRTDDLGQSFGQHLSPFIDKAAMFLGRLMDKFSKIDPKWQRAIALIAGMTVVFALIAGPLLLFIGMLPLLAMGFGAIGAAALPVTLAIAGIAAAVAGGIAIWRNWDKVVQFVMESGFGRIIKDLIFLKDNWREIWSRMQEIFQTVVKNVLQGVENILNGFVDMVNGALRIAKKLGLMSDVAEIDKFEFDYDVMMTAIKKKTTEVVEAVVEKTRELGTSLKEGVGGAATDLKAIMAGVLDDMGLGFDELDKKLKKGLVTTLDTDLPDALKKTGDAGGEAGKQMQPLRSVAQSGQVRFASAGRPTAIHIPGEGEEVRFEPLPGGFTAFTDQLTSLLADVRTGNQTERRILFGASLARFGTIFPELEGLVERIQRAGSFAEKSQEKWIKELAKDTAIRSRLQKEQEAWAINPRNPNRITGAGDPGEGEYTEAVHRGLFGLAHGGIVTRPTVAMLGEAGPEAVVPLGGGRGMAPTYNITISGNTVFGEMDFKRLVVKAVTDSHRRGGLPFLGKA